MYAVIFAVVQGVPSGRVVVVDGPVLLPQIAAALALSRTAWLSWISWVTTTPRTTAPRRSRKAVGPTRANSTADVPLLLECAPRGPKAITTPRREGRLPG